MKWIKFAMVVLCMMLFATACAPTVTIDYDPEIAVPLGIVEDLQFSDTSKLTIDDCEQRLTDIAKPSEIKEGDVIPAEFVLLIDLDEVYMSWDDFPMSALCVKGNWGLFRTNQTITLPNHAKVWAINNTD